jgi:hypothetical protein
MKLHQAIGAGKLLQLYKFIDVIYYEKQVIGTSSEHNGHVSCLSFGAQSNEYSIL